MTDIFVHHLRRHDGVLRVPRAGAVVWDDEDLHAAAYRRDPVAYALSALGPGIHSGQRARVLLRLLTASWAGLEPGPRETLNRVARVLALGLAPADVLTVLLAARRRRANHKHVTRVALAVLFEHPRAAEIVGARRGLAVDCFEHALGKATARGRYAALTAADVPATADAAADVPATARGPRAASGTAGDAGRGVGGHFGLSTLAALYEPSSVDVALPGALLDFELAGERPGTVTATNRGDLAATLVHLYRGGPAGELLAAADGYARAITDGMPRYDGRIALVVDQSASMRGYGTREWAVLSQVAALRMVLERVAPGLVVVEAGGVDGRPGGATDLASAVLDAAETGPDVIAVASDGYENVYPGDLARVAAALPGAGIAAPVVFCQAAFGRADDLALRRAAGGLPLRTFWHSGDLAGLVLWMLSQVDGPEAGRWVGLELRRRLAALETALEGVPR
ncbi:hypothetical protein [Dactylosporangium sp. CS-033363]|uniref:hypothetical protein n=1 Tax=Dactylosporangium sp. CS-033363 TaxID=3239935 RepID=UPI003D903BC0